MCQQGPRLKEQIVIYYTPEYTRAILADREREIEKMRTVRKARQARSETVKPAGGRRRRTRHRKPLEA
jgi:hypothetical protein